jgi:hypothetical protein
MDTQVVFTPEERDRYTRFLGEAVALGPDEEYRTEGRRLVNKINQGAPDWKPLDLGRR